MGLGTGTRLGHYEILSSIGAGGMGEVYRARDTRLGRIVAIKILPDDKALDVEARERFLREARAISSLNHPHICTLHDVGREADIDYLVMELLEGETLASRLERGPVPIDEAVVRGIEILDAISAAHTRGIVHRDLKPGNIMLTASGVKLLDFGLARLRSPSVGGEPRTVSTATTELRPLTGPFQIVGTVFYMAPEQIEGRLVDARVDIFAFGTLFYEMLTGHRAFGGGSEAAVMAAILERQPPSASSIRAEVPARLGALIDGCLVKNPAGRWQSAHDVAIALSWLQKDEPPGHNAGATPSRRRERVAWAAVTIGLALALVSALLRTAGPPIELPPVRLSLPPPPETRFPTMEAFTFQAVSPDGRQVLFTAGKGGKRQLWARPLDAEEARPIPGVDEPLSPFWSPDSRNVGYFSKGLLKRVDLEGAPPQTICAARLEGGADWSREGIILFGDTTPGHQGIYQVPAEGGAIVQVTRVDSASGEQVHTWPSFLPDGRHFLFLSVARASRSGPAVASLRLGSLDSPSTTSLPEIDSRAVFAAPEHIVYARGGALMTRPFDMESLRPRGDPIRLADQLTHHQGSGMADFSVSLTGVIAYHAGVSLSSLILLSMTGERTGEIGTPADIQELRPSPDGRSLATSVRDPETGTHDIWIYDVASGISTRLTSDAADESAPVWSSDGSKIIFRSDRNGPPDILSRRVDGTGEETEVVAAAGVQEPEDVSPDGKWLLYVEYDRERGTDEWLVSLDGLEKPRPFLVTPFHEAGARISPDGKWVALHSNESGQLEVYLVPFRTGTAKRRISPNGGRVPRWSPDGKSLFYITPAGGLMVVPIDTVSGTPTGPPRTAFRVDSPLQWGDYAALSGGRGFVVSHRDRNAADAPIQIILNWPAVAAKQGG